MINNYDILKSDIVWLVMIWIPESNKPADKWQIHFN